MATKRRKINDKKIQWTEEKKDYLKKIYIGKRYKEIANLMAEKFNEDYTESQVGNMLKRLQLKTGTSNIFKKGHIPWCKGKGKVKIKKNPRNKKVGTERKDKEGYILIKVAEPNKWELKHRIIYEKHNGKIPAGKLVIFADKDKNNFDIDNLLVVSKEQIATLNRVGLIHEDKELTKVGVNISNIILKMGERKNE